MEYDLNERRTSRENGFNGRQLQITLTLIVDYVNKNRSQFDLELGKKSKWNMTFVKYNLKGNLK